jgi:hypothetical protein
MGLRSQGCTTPGFVAAVLRSLIEEDDHYLYFENAHVIYFQKRSTLNFSGEQDTGELKTRFFIVYLPFPESLS